MSNREQEPASARASRIGPLANLPVFFKLEGKRVVLVGGGEPALWKAELLAAAGALVDVFSDAFADGFRELAASPPSGRIVLIDRRWAPADLAPAALAVGSFADDAEAAAFASAARAAGVPVNVVDRPAFCDFQFGAIVNRSPLVVGISTDGAAPVFGQAIRSLVESLLPDTFRLWTAAARDLRRAGDRFGDTPEKKRRFWQRFTDLAVRNSERGPTDADLDRLLAGEPPGTTPGAVTIIEIDGDVDALTLGAVRALRVADDIFFDDGIAAAVTDFARREARRHPIASSESNSRAVGDALAGAATEGRLVVRLQLRALGGPGGLADETGVLRDAGISVVVIAPGAPH